MRKGRGNKVMEVLASRRPWGGREEAEEARGGRIGPPPVQVGLKRELICERRKLSVKIAKRDL